MGAFALKWFLGGGWKWLLLAGVVGGAYLYITGLQSEAAKVPALEATVAGKQALIVQMQHADADRDKADKDLSTWQGASAAAFNALRAGMKHAPIATNPVCLPSAADRLQRNSTLDQLLPAPAVPAK